MYRPGSSKPTSRSQSPPSPATLISINTVLESIKNRIERSEPLRMEAFLQLETSALATNNNPLINLIKDMVSTLKKSAAALNSNAAGSSDKVDPALVVCKCKFPFSAKFHFVFQNSQLQLQFSKIPKIQFLSKTDFFQNSPFFLITFFKINFFQN